MYGLIFPKAQWITVGNRHHPITLPHDRIGLWPALMSKPKAGCVEYVRNAGRLTAQACQVLAAATAAVAATYQQVLTCATPGQAFQHAEPQYVTNMVPRCSR
jgi:hypothetical protein